MEEGPILLTDVFVPEVDTLPDIEFASFGDRKLRLTVHRHFKAAGGRHPGIIYVHGGKYSSGGRHILHPIVLRLAQHGYVCANIEYRYSREAPFPAQLFDCRSALAWLRDHSSELGLDSGRIGVWGESAGGHLAALLGTGGMNGQSPVQAVVTCYGCTDFLGLDDDLRSSGYPENATYGEAGSCISDLFDGTAVEKPEAWRQADPRHHITGSEPPFLILHGDSDPYVPAAQSRKLHESLITAGVDSTLHVVRGAGHRFPQLDADEMIVRFFDKHLRA